LAWLYVGNTDKLTAEGQSLFGKGHLPGFLLGSYLRGDNLRIPVFRYLPMGAMGSDPTQQILPQGDFMSILGGQDWKGGRLKNADGSDPDAMQLAAYAAYAYAATASYAASAAYAAARDDALVNFLDELLDQWELAAKAEDLDLYVSQEWEEEALTFVSEMMQKAEAV